MAKTHAPIAHPRAQAPVVHEPDVAAPGPDLVAAVTAPRDPRTVIGFETATGEYAYEPVADPDWRFDRRILLRGVNYEHTTTDADGVWIYRSM